MPAAVETMAWVKEHGAPWHGLGVPVSNRLTAEQMMIAAGVDWEVAKFDNVCQVGKERVHTGTKALIRLSDNRVLSPSVGPDWNPVQNREAFDFFHKFVSAGHMTMETAGSLRDGQIVWALAKVGESFRVFKDDVVDSYLLFSNSHQYGSSMVVDWTAIRVVCLNTLVMALNSKSQQQVRINHRSQFNPARVEELLGIAHGKLDSYKEQAEFLGSVQVKGDELLAFMKKVFPLAVPEGKDSKKAMSNNAKNALVAFEKQPGAEFAPGTWWQAFNAVTYMADHVLCKEDDTRLYNAWYGGTKKIKADALKLALEMAEA